MDIKVAIYQRVKDSDGWHERYVPLPPRIKRTKGEYTLFSKDDREGAFLISWYENRKKKRQAVEGRLLSDALKLAKSKALYLNSTRHGVRVAEPTAAEPRKDIIQQAELYLTAKSGRAKTLSAHRLALKEFREFCAKRKRAYMEEIDRSLLLDFYKELVDGGNRPITAAQEVLRVNSFYRAVMKLAAGKGLLTKKDFKRELATSRVPEIYARAEMDALFSHMDEDEHLLYSVFREAGLRKEELMHLEDTDLLVGDPAPGVFKCGLRVQRKPHWRWMPNAGQERIVLIPRGLMGRLQQRKAAPRPSGLLFGTLHGKPDYHLGDKLKRIAQKAGLDPRACRVQKFRATAAAHWLRSKELGGKGWDIGFVRQQLGQEDLRSIEHYVALVHDEAMALGMARAAVLNEEEASRTRENIAYLNPDAVMFGRLDAALIGATVERRPRAVYSMEMMLEVIRATGPQDLEEEEAQDDALDYFSYAIVGTMETIDEKVRPVIVDTSWVG